MTKKNKVKLVLLWIVNLSTLILGIICGVTWWARLQLDYNEGGNYFDEANSVVYDKDAVLVYGVLTLMFLVIGLISGVSTWKLKHKT